MGEVEIDHINRRLIIRADLWFYGYGASERLARAIGMEVQHHWNLPGTAVFIGNYHYQVLFNVNGFYSALISEMEVLQNTDPRKNFFRVEEYANGNISFVDGIGSNTGYFKLDNLLNNSTTASHEFGHTIGLPHPHKLDLRGGGIPGIMYPRGTIVDPAYQYDPAAEPLAPGGTMNPFFRKVLAGDIEQLNLNKLRFNSKGFAILGDFSSLYHEAHHR